MSIAAAVLMIMLSSITRAGQPNCVSMRATQPGNSLSAQIGQIKNSQIKVTIATGGGPYLPTKDTYRVGEPVPLVITMTNTGSQPVYVCESGTLYQDRPQLLKDGRPVPYKSFRQSMVQAAEKDQTCQNDNMPQQVLLRPNEPVVVDWSNLAEGATSLYDDGWYESLQAGKYTLSIQRRLTCCDGEFVVSNTIDFVVVP